MSETKKKTFAVLTSGGDAPGMNRGGSFLTSTTSSSRRVSASSSLPRAQPHSRLASVRDAIPDPASSPSAAMPDRAAPRTR